MKDVSSYAIFLHNLLHLAIQVAQRNRLFSLFFVHIDGRCIELRNSAQVRANLCRNLCKASKPWYYWLCGFAAQVAQVKLDILFPGDLCSEWYIGKKVCNLCRCLPYLVQTPAAQGFAGCTGCVHRFLHRCRLQTFTFNCRLRHCKAVSAPFLRCVIL